MSPVDGIEPGMTSYEDEATKTHETTHLAKRRAQRRTRLVCDGILVRLRTITIAGKNNNTKDFGVGHGDGRAGHFTW